MWYLVEVKDSSVTLSTQEAPKHWLGGVNGGGRTIGRKHVDIRLKASSVSRTHAKIAIREAAFYSPSAACRRHRQQSTCVFVQDSSAYGTFLKYPPGHSSNRAEHPVGHHRRLDKDTPTEVSEGALLAFGAPSSWWKLGWESLVVVPAGLSGAEEGRLMNVVGVTGVEFSKTWGENATHLITSTCSASSMKFLTALAHGKHVVSPSWLESLHHIVKECCKSIADAPNDEAAMSTRSLPDEQRFIPPFSRMDRWTFPVEDLDSVFDASMKEKRAGLFKDTVLAFTREERRSRWAGIIEKLGGKTTVTAVMAGNEIVETIIVVRADRGSTRKGYEQIDASNRDSVTESAIAAAIFRADLSCLDARAGPVNPTPADPVDIATPGPLDAESGAESDETGRSDPVDEQEKKRHGSARIEENCSSQAEASGLNQRGNQAVATQSTATRKRARAGSECGVQEMVEDSVIPGVMNNVTSLPAGSVHVVGKGSHTGNPEYNGREFIDVRTARPEGSAQEKSEKQLKTKNQDVRPFRRRKVPRVSKIPLRRVPYVELEEIEVFGGTSARTNARDNGSGSGGGARVVESDEE